MTDVVTPQVRSRMMAGIRGRDTAPEMMVRRYLHAAGLRFRVNDRSLPGAPDIVLPRHRCAIFVHGCFWHRHAGCRLATIPATRTDFWQAKFAGNVERDRRAQQRLQEEGWHVLTIWECEVNNVDNLDALFWQILARS